MNTAVDTMTNTSPGRVLYTARVHTTGGRDGGVSHSDDGRLDIRHSIPGGRGTGTNPEQLFAAGWSACFEGALGIAAKKLKISLPAETAIDAEVDLTLGADGYAIQGRLNIVIPGLPRDIVESLVKSAEETCPYSKAVKGNIRSEYRIV